MLSSEIINSDPGIICFQHCVSKVFCFNLPTQCPTCNCQLTERDLNLFPFRLPYPFVKATQYPCSVVLRPTNGNFLNDYNNSMDLHIAVTTSRGIIVEFDQNGLQKIRKIETKKGIINNEEFGGQHDKSSNWSQSLLVENVSEPWYDLWDSVLDEICKQPNWTVDDYKEDTYNCYTFVLKFLQSFKHYDQKLTEAAENKMKFCEMYIIPKTIAAGKYISLYRKIRDNGIYTHLINNTKENKNDENTNENSNIDSSVNITSTSCGDSGSCGNIGYINYFTSSGSTQTTYEMVSCQQDKTKISGNNTKYNTFTNSSCCCSNNSRCTKLCTIEE